MNKKGRNIYKYTMALLGATILASSSFSARVQATETVITENDISHIGDVDGNGSINVKDVTLLIRHLAGGWDVTIKEVNADVNVDGIVNTKDVTILRRYLAGGWGVQLKPKEEKPKIAPFSNQILTNDTLGVLVKYDQESAREMLESINSLRCSNDELNELVWDYDLEKAAMQRAAEIAIKFSAKYRPDGKSNKQSLADYGFNISPRGISYGENILFADNNKLSNTERAFSKYSVDYSSRDNILGYYETIGISHITFDDLDFWVLLFSGTVKNTTEEDCQPVCGDRYVSLKVPLTLISRIQADYISGAKSISVGQSIPIPFYTASAKFLDSEVDLIPVRPATDNDDDCFLKFESGDNKYVKVENGYITGLNAGQGTIYATYLGFTVSVPFEVTE